MKTTWPTVELLNWTHHCGAWPAHDGSGLLLYPDNWLPEDDRQKALRFARENLSALLKELCLDHLPHVVSLAGPPKQPPKRLPKRLTLY